MNGNQNLNPYEILGINKNATQAEIHKAFKRLSRQYHPDQFDTDEEKKKASQKFSEIANAYNILKNEKARKLYDTRGQYENANVDFEEISKHFQGSSLFENLFSNAFGRSASNQQHRTGFSFNTNNHQNVPFDDIGAFFNMASSSSASNRGAAGSGAASSASQVMMKKKAQNQYKDLEVTLKQLYEGTVVNMTINNYELKIPIKAGLKPNSRITFESKASKENLKKDEIPGDLVLIVKLAKNSDDKFRLEDRNIVFDLVIDLAESISNNERVFEVKAIDNSIHQIKFAPSQIIKHGHREVIKNLGLPSTKPSVIANGDFIINFYIDLPDLSQEKRDEILAILKEK